MIPDPEVTRAILVASDTVHPNLSRRRSRSKPRHGSVAYVDIPRAAKARNNPPRQCSTSACRVLAGQARWWDGKRGRLARLRTRKGSLLEDEEAPVFTTRARSVAKVLAAPAMSADQAWRLALVAAFRLARVLEADLLM